MNSFWNFFTLLETFRPTFVKRCEHFGFFLETFRNFSKHFREQLVKSFQFSCFNFQFFGFKKQLYFIFEIIFRSKESWHRRQEVSNITKTSQTNRIFSLFFLKKSHFNLHDSSSTIKDPKGQTHLGITCMSKNRTSQQHRKRTIHTTGTF